MFRGIATKKNLKAKNIQLKSKVDDLEAKVEQMRIYIAVLNKDLEEEACHSKTKIANLRVANKRFVEDNKSMVRVICKLTEKLEEIALSVWTCERCSSINNESEQCRCGEHEPNPPIFAE